MELPIIKNGTTHGKATLPAQFSEPIRIDLIKRAFLAIQSHQRQSYGAKVGAGQRQVGKLSRRRRKYKGSYGKGISRVPRKTMSRNGSQMSWVGAVAPGTVGGREAHPPKAWKDWNQKLNKNENRKATRSAMAASLDKTLAAARGHAVPSQYPFIVSDIETIKSTQDLLALLTKMGLEGELARASKRTIRAGKGKGRGRPYQHAVGPLIVFSAPCDAQAAAHNIPGVDTITINKLNAHILAPGGHAGRLTLYTDKAIEKLSTEKLFA
ncbi:50S ribosomal protein L4 [Candidatus Woesearchaeota archaeon]|nr:50S ribosomal protein L4 [Candidatus Woesearchaeota archaeon]